MVAPPGETCRAGAAHFGFVAAVTLPRSVAPAASTLPATKGRGAGRGSVYSDPPARSGGRSQTIARPGERSDASDEFDVATINRRRGAPPGLESDTDPPSVMTMVSRPSRKGCPNRAVLRPSGAKGTFVGGVVAVGNDALDRGTLTVPRPLLHADRTSTMPTPTDRAATRGCRATADGGVIAVSPNDASNEMNVCRLSGMKSAGRMT